MARCFVTRTLPFPALDALAQRHEVDVWEGELPPPQEALRQRAAQADGLLCLLTDRIDAALLQAAPRLKVVSNYAVGADNVDLSATAERGVPVGVTPDVLTDSTADIAMGLVLGTARRFAEAVRDVRQGEWRTFEPARWLGLELSGARLAIVGPGRIGRAVAHRAEAFGMEVELVKRGDDLHQALARADVVSLHTPLTHETRHLIGAAELQRMKPTAILINTARGAIVDSAALREALLSGTIAAAGLDVTDPEPLPPDHPLLEAPNLLVLPHIGSATHAARARMADIAVSNLLAGLDGTPLPHPAPH